jgi:hypothetical protein
MERRNEMKRLTNPKHGSIRSIRMPNDEFGAIQWAQKLAEYEDILYDENGNELISKSRLEEIVQAEKEGRQNRIPYSPQSRSCIGKKVNYEIG